MILIEATHWPLVVVGAVPPARAAAITSASDDVVWFGHDLRLAVVVPGTHEAACRAEAEVTSWLRQRRALLRRTVGRIAWVFEDERRQQAADLWIALAGDRLFGAPCMTCRSLRVALEWLTSDPSSAAVRAPGRSP